MKINDKLPEVFGDLASIEAYSDLTGIDQEVLKEQGSSYNAMITIGDTCYLRLSTFLMNQLSKLKISDGTENEAIDLSQIISPESTISEYNCLSNHLSALSSIKLDKLKNLFIQMLKEKDPQKRIDIAREYNLIYFNIDKITRELEFTKKRLREVGDKRSKMYESMFEDDDKQSTLVEKKLNIQDTSQIKWVTIGRAYLDSGTILLCDPLRVLENVDFMRETAAMGNVQHYRQVGDDIGVLSRTGFGSGVYEVEALVRVDAEVVIGVIELRIRFNNSDDLDE